MFNTKLIRMILILLITSGFFVKLLNDKIYNDKIQKIKNNLNEQILPGLNNRYEFGILMEILKGK